MEIYLDANATTPVLAEARDAALAAMTEDFGNPSSTHTAGLRARALVDGVRARARRVLGAPTGRLLFLSGATEGIQTSVLSALQSIAARRAAGQPMPTRLLYGATEHKAVPEALRHWNALLGLGLEVTAIPVDRQGRHDLAWLRAHSAEAGLVCTMAANNETGVVSDLAGIADGLAGSPALWMVDSVQALGKLTQRLDAEWSGRRIDYAPYSGHKLYAPKGIGLLYVRDGAPFTPLMAGGGQEGASRSGTENMAGIAALGAVLTALESGHCFRDHATLTAFRDRLADALARAFPGLVFNVAHASPTAPRGAGAPRTAGASGPGPSWSPEAGTVVASPAGGAAPALLPTTLNFSVPALSSKLMLDLFDAAGMRISAGSACGAGRAEPSHVLQAMGLPAWQTESAVRLSFGPMVDEAFITEACARIRACGEAVRATCRGSTGTGPAGLADGVTRHEVDGACCYVLADAATRRCVVIDPLPELTQPLSQWLGCQGYALAAVLDTHSHGDHASSAPELRAALPADAALAGPVDALGWPQGHEHIAIGPRRLTRLATPGHTEDSTTYLLHDAAGLATAFVGDMVMPGALGRSDFAQSAPLAFAPSLRALARVAGLNTMLLPGHDYDQRLATTLAVEAAAQPLLGAVLDGSMDARAFAAAKATLEAGLGLTEYQTLACGARVEGACEAEAVELEPAALQALLAAQPAPLLVDVREAYEQRLGRVDGAGGAGPLQAVPLSSLLNALPGWLALPPQSPLVFVCRSGARSALAARALRRLGRRQAFSLAGGMALWPAMRG
jgi:cysteine sulfinate desulfinase/cysteine desulfurase-like protein/glyoxylase-like metal-dependent hydrolase (beta-lactamase superfamily II)/rhodanese-related sulfurtransferase